MSSPPSPYSPPTPEWILEARAEAAIREKEERDRKGTYIRLVIVGLDKFPKNDNLVSFLVTTLRSDMDLDKRYLIAQALNDITENQNLDNSEVRVEIREKLRTDALNMESALYRALNYQRGIPITFFGAMGGIRCDYARTLQKVHKCLQDEAKAEENKISFDVPLITTSYGRGG